MRQCGLQRWRCGLEVAGCEDLWEEGSFVVSSAEHKVSFAPGVVQEVTGSDQWAGVWSPLFYKTELPPPLLVVNVS